MREVETERLHLRQWRHEDISPFAEFCASPSTARFVGGACGRDDAWRRMAMFLGHWALRGYGNWVIEEKGSGTFAGYGGLWNPLGWPEPELMWGLRAQFQRRGYATEAAWAARDVAYRELGWATIVSYIASENLPSQRVATRLGALLEGSIDLRGSPVGVYRHPGRNSLQH